MAWAKNGTPDTLSATGDLEISDLTAKQFNVLLFHLWENSGTINTAVRFNNNTNTVYARRVSPDGGAESTSVSQTYWVNNGNTQAQDIFAIYYVISISGEEKLGIGFHIEVGTAGAASAPSRSEAVTKFVPSPDADITEVDVLAVGGATGQYASGSNLSALGTD